MRVISHHRTAHSEDVWTDSSPRACITRNMNPLSSETLDNGTNEKPNNTFLYHERQSASCLPWWVLNATSVQSVYFSDVVLTIINIPFATFAFLVNLVVTLTIIRTPSLHRPVNVLLCSLAAADCLTGLVGQPVYASWRFALHHVVDPCKLVHLYQASKSLPFLLIGCTFLNLAITSVERLYAVSKPMAYSARVTLRGMLQYIIPHHTTPHHTTLHHTILYPTKHTMATPRHSMPHHTS